MGMKGKIKFIIIFSHIIFALRLDTHLKIAKIKLMQDRSRSRNNYALWDFYERLPDFIEDFANYLQVPVPAHVQVNITAYRPKVTEISSDLRAKLKSLMPLILHSINVCRNEDEARQTGIALL